MLNQHNYHADFVFGFCVGGKILSYIYRGVHLVVGTGNGSLKAFLFSSSLLGRILALLGFDMPSEIMDLPDLSSSSYFSEDVCFPNEVLSYRLHVYVSIQS